MWQSSLDDVFVHVAGAFGRAEPRGWARAYVTGLLTSVERKNSWQLAEEAGVVSPDGCRHLLNRARSSADEVRDQVRACVVEALASAVGVLWPMRRVS
ncbi:transposase [Nocardia gamkensis]|uniref:transposase n=1 Tax=Nocardia gamkensis TaxID=352869 RepID=UPI0037C91FE1